MSRINLEDTIAERPRLIAPRLGVYKATLSGALGLPADGPTVFELDPNGSDRTISLPTPNAKGASVFYIKNTGSANVLNIVDHLGAAVTTIGVGGMSIFVSGATSWSLLASIPLYIADGTEALPGLAFSADTNNGLYRIGADDWGLVAGGKRLIRLTGTGNLATSVVAFDGTKAATSTTSASATFAGGVGIAGSAYVGAPLFLSGGATGASPTPQLDFGDYLDNSGNVSVSHISLYGTEFGFGIASSQLVYVVPAANVHAFYTATSLTTARLSIGDSVVTTVNDLTLNKTNPTIYADNGSSATNLFLKTRSTGGVSCTNDSGQIYFQMAPAAASIANYMQWVGTGTGANPYVAAQGSDTHVGMTFLLKGASSQLLFSINAVANLLTSDATKTAVLQTTASTSTTTGALTVGGGVGVAGAIYGGGVISAAAASGFYLGSTLFALLNTGIVQIYDNGPSPVIQLQAGGTDTTYLSNTTHIFRARGGGSNLGTINAAGAIFAQATAIPAGGTAGTGVKFSSTTNFGVFFGSGAPTLSAAKGSIYLRSDGSGTTDRAYINTDGGTTWTALTTVA